MSEQTGLSSPTERRARELFDSGVESLDPRLQKRLSQARRAAVEATAGTRHVARRRWVPVASLASATLVAVLLWRTSESPSYDAAATAVLDASVESIELLTDQEGLELIENDLAFYDWVDAMAAEQEGGRG